MGFLKKIFKPISKVLDKIVPNEIKPLLPYAAAFAPMVLGPGIMGSSMLQRGLMSGGLNIGAQLAQEGNEGDINALSALLAGGIGALSAPGKTGVDFSMSGSGEGPMLTEGAGSFKNFAQSGIDRFGADSAIGEIAKGGLKASKFLTDPGLLKFGVPTAQGTADLAYADAMRAEKDFEDSQGDGSGYVEGDQNRGLAVRRAMERGGHEEQTIQDMLESLGYEDPDPQPLASGGRVGYSLGNLVTGSGIAQPMSASMNAGDRPMMSSSGMGGMLSNMVNNNSQLFSSLAGQRNNPVSNMSQDFIDENQNGIDDRQEKAYGGRIGYEGGGGIMDTIVGMFKKENKEPDFNSMAETVEAVESKPKEMLVDKLKVTIMPGQSEMRAIIEAMYNDTDGVMPDDRKKEFYELYAPQMYRNGEMDKTEFEFIQSEILDKDMNQPVAKKDGGMMSVLPEGMEMDYRQGGMIPMGSKERADDVPARVSKNEFVMTADAVRAAGGGSVNEGARRMYNLMNNLEART